MSAAVAAAAAAALANRRNSTDTTTAIKNRSYTTNHHLPFPSTSPRHNRYEMAKQQDWNTFGQYLRNHHHQGQSPVSLQRCSGFHVLGFLKYLDQFGEIKVHISTCMFYGNTHRPAACSCPLKQAWTSLDATVSRLRAAFEEHGGSPETNPFGSPAVWLYLRETKECQAKASGLNYGG